MKYCLLADGSPYLIHFLAKLTHQMIKESDECIVVGVGKILEYNMRKKFPKDIKFLSKVDWCIENYKKDWREFPGLSWRDFFSTFDRKTRDDNIDFNYKNSVEIISQFYQFFNSLFQKEKPDVVISEPPANVFTQIAYRISKRNNILYLGIIPSRFKDRIDIYDLEYTCSVYEKDFRENPHIDILKEDEKEEVQDFEKKFIAHQQLPSYMGKKYYYGIKGFLRHWTDKTKFQSRIKYLLNRKKFKEFDHESEGIMWATFLLPYKDIKRKLRILFQKNIYNSPNDDDIFFLFPLQLQPEASTSVLATYFSDQLTTIKNIAFSLPFSYRLYVKEHPVAVGTRPGVFYKTLKKIPNVVLLSPYENVENLIKKSKGVITLTSTVGMEAALSGKPVYVLGKVFYSYHPLCKKVDNFEELAERIKIDLENPPILNNLKQVNRRFIISYFKNTIKADVFTAYTKNDFNDYELIYRDIKRLISKLKSHE